MGESPGAGRWKHRTERHNQQYTIEKQNCEYEPSLMMASRKGWRNVCVPTCKGAVPGHAGGTVVRGISRELR